MPRYNKRQQQGGRLARGEEYPVHIPEPPLPPTPAQGPAPLIYHYPIGDESDYINALVGYYLDIITDRRGYTEEQREYAQELLEEVEDVLITEYGYTDDEIDDILSEAAEAQTED